MREELGNRGYVVNLHAHRQGEILVGQVHVTSAETNETVAKVVGAGKVEDLRLCFGVDAEGVFRDMIFKAFGAWQGVQTLMPEFVFKESKP